MRTVGLVVVFLLLSMCVGNAQDTSSRGASWEYFATDSWKAKATAYTAVYDQVKKAAEAGDFDNAKKWGDLINGWENPSTGQKNIVNITTK